MSQKPKELHAANLEIDIDISLTPGNVNGAMNLYLGSRNQRERILDLFSQAAEA